MPAVPALMHAWIPADATTGRAIREKAGGQEAPPPNLRCSSHEKKMPCHVRDTPRPAGASV